MKGQDLDGGPAFPVRETVRDKSWNDKGYRLRDIQHQGVSLRAYAAIAALPQAMQEGRMTPKEAAQSALEYADALLEELDA